MPGIYIHIPFCRKKCPYCGFNSSIFTEDEEKLYVKALIREMELLKKNEDINGWEFESLYMGGGTPTSLKTENIIHLFEKAFSVFCEDTASMEVTMEGNPESATFDKLKAAKDCGCNRLSLGFQDLSSKGLKTLGRSHTVKQSLNAYETARKAGFDNISIDLIYGWPGQTKDEWRKTLRLLTSLSPEHISCYELTIEDGTPFARAHAEEKLSLPPEEETLAMMDISEEYLSLKGYHQYELSNFAKSGRASRHNSNYWENGSYLGLGCSAASFIPPLRRKNTDDISFYIKEINSSRLPMSEKETLDLEQRLRESVILALRTTNGLNIMDINKKFSIDVLDYYGDLLKRHIDLNLIKVQGHRIFLSRQGRRIANFVLKDLV